MKLRVNDNVVILTGKDKGKTGSVVRIFKKKGKVLVEGLNMKVKHVKAQQGQAGERVEAPFPIEASNVALVDPKTNKPTRIGYKIEGGQKVRFAKQSGTVLPASKASKK